MNTDEIKRIISNMRALQPEKDALMKQALSGNKNALFAVYAMARRQQGNAK
jgi:hypothetical protein